MMLRAGRIHKAISELLEGGKFFKLEYQKGLKSLQVYKEFVAESARVETFQEFCKKYPDVVADIKYNFSKHTS